MALQADEASGPVCAREPMSLLPGAGRAEGHIIGRLGGPLSPFGHPWPGARRSECPDALFQAVFDSLGAGTFLYIATLDIIKTEFDSPRYCADNWGAAVLGFAIMAAPAIWI